MKICELHRLFPPDRRTHIFVYERLDPRTLEHAQADEGRCYWRVLVGGRATPGQKVTREGGGVGWDCGWRGESVCEDRNSSAYTRGEDEKYISLLTVPNKTKTKNKSLLCLLYQQLCTKQTSAQLQARWSSSSISRLQVSDWTAERPGWGGRIGALEITGHCTLKFGHLPPQPAPPGVYMLAQAYFTTSLLANL